MGIIRTLWDYDAFSIQSLSKPDGTGISQLTYHIVRIVTGAPSRQDCRAGEEVRYKQIEGWAGDQLPPPVHFFPADLFFKKNDSN